jgi:hypothetical protein
MYAFRIIFRIMSLQDNSLFEFSMTVHLNLNQINQSIQLNIFIAAISHINGLNGGHIKLVLE